jgi:hypothetical protein
VVWSGPNSGLTRALEIRRSVVHQTVLLAVFLLVCAAWRLSPIHEPEPLIKTLLGIGAAALVFEGVLGWLENDRANGYTDDLVMAGFTGRQGQTPTDRAVRRRIERIQLPRARGRLAADLRWRLKVAQGGVRRSPGLARTGGFAPIGLLQRRVWCDEADLITRIAEDVERDEVDPRALVILWRALTLPPVVDTGRAPQRDDEHLRRQLHAARDLIAPDVDPGVDASCGPR